MFVYILFLTPEASANNSVLIYSVSTKHRYVYTIISAYSKILLEKSTTINYCRLKKSLSKWRPVIVSEKF
jgi:hypothetical protein